MNTRKLTTMAILAAISVVLVYLVHFPIFSAAPYLEYDPADIPLMIASFMYGPVAGLLVTALTCAIQAVTVSASSGIIGFFMHFFATGALVIVTGFISQKYRSNKCNVVALILGIIVATVLMVPLNLIFTPMYGTPIDVVKSLLLPVIVPFNLIKFTLNSVVTFLVYTAIKGHIKN